jgi:hypothetical protein
VKYDDYNTKPLPTTRGNFIKITDCHGNIDIKGIKEKLYELEAESVEFAYGEIGIESSNPGFIRTGDFSIEPLLEEYNRIQMPARRQEIGRQIREFNYRIPKI